MNRDRPGMFDYANIDKTRFASIYTDLVEADAISEYFLTPTTADKVVLGVHKALRGAVTDLAGKHHLTNSESRKYSPLADEKYTADVIADIAVKLYDPNVNPAKRHGAFADFSEFFAPVPKETAQAIKRVETIARDKKWDLDPWRHNPNIGGHWEHSALRYNKGTIEERKIDVSISHAGVVSIDRSPHYRSMVVSIETPKLINHALEERIAREEALAELGNLYGYIIDDVSSGSVSADVINGNKQRVFNIYGEDELEQLGMKNIEDLEALTEHLKPKRIGVNAVILPEQEFDKKRDSLMNLIAPKVAKLDTVIVTDMIESSIHVVAEVYGQSDRDEGFFLSLTDGKEYSTSSVRTIVRSPSLESSISSMDRTDHDMLIRSKDTGVTSSKPIRVWSDQDIKGSAFRIASSFGADVISVDGVDFNEILKQKKYLNIQIDNTRNASFEDIGNVEEVGRILRNAKSIIEGAQRLSDVDGHRLTDTNDNAVGVIQMTNRQQTLKPGNIRIEIDTNSLNTPEKVIPFIDAAIEGIQNGKNFFQLRTDDSKIEIVEEYKNLPKVAQVFVVGDPIKNKVHTYDTGLEL